jgi:hypothetical protein
MLVSAQERNEEVCKYVVGIIFLGTPHNGSPLTRFGTLLSYFSYWSGSSTSLLDVVQTESTENRNLHRNFTNLRHNHHYLKEMGNIVCVFEAVRESFLGFALTHVCISETGVVQVLTFLIVGGYAEVRCD